MRKALRRLRLREGDIVLVRDYETLGALEQAGRGMKEGTVPNCPIVVAPEGVHRLSKEYLRKLLNSVSTEQSGTDAKSGAATSTRLPTDGGQG